MASRRQKTPTKPITNNYAAIKENKKKNRKKCKVPDLRADWRPVEWDWPRKTKQNPEKNKIVNVRKEGYRPAAAKERKRIGGKRGERIPE